MPHVQQGTSSSSDRTSSSTPLWASSSDPPAWSCSGGRSPAAGARSKSCEVRLRLRALSRSSRLRRISSLASL
eukprot:1422080-Alexandrium_andersonii.AAC.1